MKENAKNIKCVMDQGLMSLQDILVRSYETTKQYKREHGRPITINVSKTPGSRKSCVVSA